MNSQQSQKPYSIMRLHESCGNFAILEQTREFDLFYKCTTCNVHLQPQETIDMENYIKQQRGEIPDLHQHTTNINEHHHDSAFLPFQIVTFSKNKDVRTPIAANEFIVHDKTNHRELFYCPSCKKDQMTILIPNNLRDLSFKRICETCRHIS